MTINSIKVDQLRYFCETVKASTVTLAARRLHVSASAISHAIARLEGEIGRELFSKKGKSLFLTAHGKHFYQRAAHILGDLDQLAYEMVEDDVGLRGHYRIAATHYFCEKLLAPALASLHKKHPLITVDLISLHSGEVIQQLSKGELDYGLLLAPLESSEVMFETLCEMPLEFASRLDHPFGVSPKATDLNQYSMIAPHSLPGILSCEEHPFFARFGIKPKVSMRYNSYMSAISILESSDTWSLLPEIVLVDHEKSLARLKLPGWDFKIPVSCGLSKIKKETKFTQALTSYIKGILEHKLCQSPGQKGEFTKTFECWTQGFRYFCIVDITIF